MVESYDIAGMAMKDKYNNLVKDTFIFALGKFGSKMILFLLVPLYTHYLTTEDYGISDLALTLSQTIVPIVSAMIFDGVMRFGLDKKENTADVLLIGFFVATVGCTCTLLLVPCAALYEPIYKWRWYIYGNTVLYIFYNLGLNNLKAQGNNKGFAGVSLFQTAAIAFLNILLLTKFRMGISGYLLACNGSYLLATVVSYLLGDVWNSLRKATLDRRLLKEMLLFSAPIAANVLAWDAVSTIDRIMIERMIGAEVLGLYALAVKIPSMINVFTAVFQQSWSISSIKEYESTDSARFYSNVLEVYYLGIFSLCFLLCALMKPFMSVYVGKSFLESWRYVPLLLVAACFNALCVYYAGIFGALKQSMNTMYSVLVSGLINVIVNLSLINHIGAFGAVVGTLASYIVMVSIRAWLLNKTVILNINYRKMCMNALLLIGHALICTNEFFMPISAMITTVLFILINLNGFSYVISGILGRLRK